MQNILRILRYVILALLVICNAIATSVAVWNQSLSPASVSVYALDVYVTITGVLGLVSTFAIIFLELAGKDSVTGKIWFECTWLSAVFVMNLVGASASSAILPQQTCVPFTPLYDACVSTRALLAFSWIITLVLLMYLTTLITSVLLLRGEFPNVWSMHVKFLPRPGPKSVLSSEPSTPVLPVTGLPCLPPIVVPVPRPFIVADDLYQHRAGFGPEYAVNYSQPQVPAVPAVPFAAQRSSSFTNETRQPLPSFYPQFIQSALQAAPEAQQPVPASATQQSARQQPPSPPPLADWPRRDVLSQPVRSKRAKISSVPSVASKATSRSTYQRPLGPRKMSAALEEGRAFDDELPSRF